MWSFWILWHHAERSGDATTSVNPHRHGGKCPRGIPGAPSWLCTPPSPRRPEHDPPLAFAPRAEEPGTNPVGRAPALRQRQHRPPSFPFQPHSFIRTVCKSVLFPHKPRIILVLSTRISSLIITRVLCDTKRFSGRFKRGAEPWAEGFARARGTSSGVSPPGGFNGERISGAERGTQTTGADRQSRALKQPVVFRAVTACRICLPHRAI